MPPAEGTPPPTYEPFAGGLTRCAVVIDTRNMHGQARKAFGRGLRPDAVGVRDALRRYGLEAQEIYAGVATKTMSSSPSELVQSLMDDNKRYAVELAKQGAIVLSGHLAERNGEIEEKQVDVLLALKVADLADRGRQLAAPFECIVVLSEDMDLMPSYEFARQRGVPVYAAAFDTIHARDGQEKWLILDERALHEICPPPAAITLGTPMRGLIARMATSTAPVQAPAWKVETWDSGKRNIVLSNSRGLTGVLHERRTRAYSGERLFLYATGIEMEPKSKRFPLLTLSRHRPESDGFEGVEAAKVLYWVQPTRVKVEIEATAQTATVSASPGHLLPGQRIAVYRTQADGWQATYYVGPLDAPPERSEWPLPDATAVVTIVDEFSKGVWRCVIDGLGTTVVVPKEHLKHAAIGDRLRVAHAGRVRSGEPLGQPLTCCLPSRSDKSDKTPART